MDETSKRYYHFTDKELCRLILPIFAEKFFSVLVGIIDTLMISYADENVVSGISVSNQLSNVFIFVFSSISLGGSIITNQYLGKRKNKLGNKAANQLILINMMISVFMMIFLMPFKDIILTILFGKIEYDVMKTESVYFMFLIFSFPSLALSESCSVLHRSINKSNVTLLAAVIMNIVNIIGNYVAIFIFDFGVVGIAISLFISRLLSAMIMFTYLAKIDNSLHISFNKLLDWDRHIMVKILKLSVPNGLEICFFQVSKTVLASIIALFGTYQIAAYAVAQKRTKI
ncbi:MAG: hypothetical protein IJ583_12085 [Firmicutes bacterium]|nr:hypothetical protein [Bacillota bacterium]